MSQVNQTLYRFSRHFFLGWTLNRWLILGLLVCPALGILVTMRGEILWLSVVIILALIAWAIIYLVWRVRQAGFVRFEPESMPNAILPTPLSFPEKIPVQVSGNFTVSGRIRYFVEEAAHYQTFKTRERVLMLEMGQTRYFLLSISDEKDAGWWYIFFMPDMVQTLELGQLFYGRSTRSAIRLTYLPEDSETPSTVFLTFDSDDARTAVLADLAADGVTAT